MEVSLSLAEVHRHRHGHQRIPQVSRAAANIIMHQQRLKNPITRQKDPRGRYMDQSLEALLRHMLRENARQQTSMEANLAANLPSSKVRNSQCPPLHPAGLGLIRPALSLGHQRGRPAQAISLIRRLHLGRHKRHIVIILRHRQTNQSLSARQGMPLLTL